MVSALDTDPLRINERKRNLNEPEVLLFTKGSKPMDAADVQAAYKRSLYLAFVDNALNELRQGRAEPFSELVSQFTPYTSSGLNSRTTSDASAASPTQLRIWLEALNHSVATFDRTHAPLIDTIVALQWTSFDDALVRPYIHFITSLAIARPEYISAVVMRAVLDLRLNIVPATKHSANVELSRRQVYDRVHTLLQALVDRIPSLPTTLSAEIHRNMPRKKDNRESHVVYFRNVLRVVEYCPYLFDEVLGACIARAIKLDAEIQVEMDEFEDDAGRLDEDVFGFNVEDPFDRFVSDVDVSPNGEDDVELDLEIDVSSSSDSSEDGLQGDEGLLRPEMVDKLKGLAAKLDAILRVLFDFLHAQYGDGQQPSMPYLPRSATGALPQMPSFLSTSSSPVISHAHREVVPSRTRLFTTLLSIFDRTVLSTFRTRHTQFLIFWYASLNSKYADTFIGHLLSHAIYDLDTSVVLRVSAASYLASFVSRAAFVDAAGARRVLSLLLEVINHQLDRLANEHRALPTYQAVQQFAMFYAVIQATFYLFCFRWRDFVLEEEYKDVAEQLGDAARGHTVTRRVLVRKWLPELAVLERAVLSPLNPFKICSPAVVTQFARMAHATDFMYAYGVIESNRRLVSEASASSTSTPVAPRTASVATPGQRPALPAILAVAASPSVKDTLREAQLDSHFPFDPFKLPLSGSYLKGLYREWQGPERAMDNRADAEAKPPPVPASSGPIEAIVALPANVFIPMHDRLSPEPPGRGVELGHSLEAMSLSPDSSFKEPRSMSLMV